MGRIIPYIIETKKCFETTNQNGMWIVNDG